MTYDDNTGVLIIKKNKKYGVASIEGKVIINIQYDDIASRGIYLYAKNANESKVYDNKGNTVDINYNRSIYETSNPDYRISTILNNGITYYGIMDKNGNKLVDENYNYIEYIYGNYFIVSGEKGTLGVINSNGRVVLDMKYTSIQKIKDKNIIQAIDTTSNINEFYSENMEKILASEINDLENTTFPDTIGEYKKEQITIENVYYVKK